MSARYDTTNADGDAPAITRVVARDGTEIAYWNLGGNGRPLLLVHGTASDHSRFRPLLPHLRPHVTVHAIDRRGRGASGDAAEYRAVREFEDVAVVVDSIASASGSSVDVYGHSYGGFCAFGAAHFTSNIGGLVLYEGWAPVKPEMMALPSEVEQRLNAVLAKGDPEGLLVMFLREVVKMPEQAIDARRTLPSWSASVAAAHTILREMRAAAGAETAFDHEEAAKVRVPVLLVTGADSPDTIRDNPEMVTAALPNARLLVLEGQQHAADILVPEDFANHIVAFLRDIR